MIKKTISICTIAASLGLTLLSSQPVSASQNPFIGEIQMVGFNFAPRGWAMCDGQLLAISNRSRLYSVNPSNAALNPIGQALSPAIAGNFVGFDFNPTVDRIRLVTEQDKI